VWGQAQVVSIAVDELAKQLYVDPGDVRVILATLTDEPIADAEGGDTDRDQRTALPAKVTKWSSLHPPLPWTQPALEASPRLG
jgi:CO/xanthine dehydrogenase Mo-binding subunit